MDEDLGFCDKLTFSMVTITDRPMYLLRRSNLQQLLSEVRKCSDALLRLGIMMPSKDNMLHKW